MPVSERILKSLTFLSIAASVVLGNWLHPYLEGQAVNDPFAVRVAIALLALVFFVLSLIQAGAALRERFYYTLYFLITAQGLYLSAINSLMHSYAFGMAIITTVVITSAESRRFLVAYVPFTIAGTVAAGMAASDPRVSRSVYLFANITLALLLYSLLNSKLALLASLRRATENERAASLAKTAFLARMSHEIRTPMNGILPMIDLLRNSRDEAEKARYFDILATSGQLLLRVVNDILDLSRIERNALNLAEEAVDLRSVAATAMELYRAKATAKRLAFDLRVDPALHAAYLTDRTRLTQVLNNLVSNALKFTQQGSVDLELRLESDQPESSVILFVIRDTGLGVPPDKQAAIFENFEQADRSIALRFGGSGLGLPISKALVELMGGNIGLKSPVSENPELPGTEFTVRLPLRKTTALEEASETPQAFIAGQFKGRRALIVEDNPVNRLVLGKTLERLGLSFDEAVDGLVALQLAQRQAYDIIFMDLEMPEMDGYETAKRLRSASGPNQHTHIACITAHTLVEQRERVLAAGMNEMVRKPFSLYEISSAVANALPAG
ncbi:MAG: ATP-binding protein [Spirochaetota bacterium]